MSDTDEPFMEHPTGEFASAVSAMASAIARLRALSQSERWIEFCAQGEGSHADAVHFAEVRVRGNELRVEAGNIALGNVLRTGGLKPDELAIQVDSGTGILQVREASPEQLARLLDGLFRGHLGIRPFEGEDDYSVGAEWCAT